jgi:hypothetical protein
MINARRKRDAMLDVTSVRSIHMRERAFNFSAHFRVWTGRTHRIILMIVYTVTQPVENWNSKLRMIRIVKFYACGPIPRTYTNPRDTKNALNVINRLYVPICIVPIIFFLSLKLIAMAIQT